MLLINNDLSKLFNNNERSLLIIINFNLGLFFFNDKIYFLFCKF